MSDREQAGWAQHEREQALAWLGLSYAQRLAWLSGAKRFSELARAAAARRVAATDAEPASSTVPV